MKSLEELKAIRDRVQNQMDMRNDNDNDTRIVIGMATCGIAAGARPVLRIFAGNKQARIKRRYRYPNGLYRYVQT